MSVRPGIVERESDGNFIGQPQDPNERLVSARFLEAGRIAAVDAYFAGLIAVVVYVHHWVVLVLWFGLLLGLPLGLAIGRKAREFAFLCLLGWLAVGAAFEVLAGQMTWTAYLVMAIVIGNFLAFDWDRPSPAPSAPRDPAFKDPVFTAAVIVLVVGSGLVLLVLANVISEVWLGPACGACGFGLAVVAIAVARWQLTR